MERPPNSSQQLGLDVRTRQELVQSIQEKRRVYALNPGSELIFDDDEAALIAQETAENHQAERVPYERSRH